MNTPAILLTVSLFIAAACFLGRRNPALRGADECLRRRHREINRRHLGDDGFTLPQVMHCIGALLLAHVVVIALHFIIMTVMGMQEPKW